MATPLVSIMTATYNASHVLRYAIRSVLDSDFQDWELIIVGDHCTDDTEQVVAAFDDPRIRFTNLARNSGQQATPNNVGIGMARGEYLCFLNHDDMYLPTHLDSMLEHAGKAPGSILLARYADIRVEMEDPDADTISAQDIRIQSGGITPQQPNYRPQRWQLASSWFMPIAVAHRAGPWRLEKDTFVTPSQDWLFRAWRSGIPVVGIPQVSVAVVCTGKRRGFFHRRRDAVHEYVYDHFVKAPGAGERLDDQLGPEGIRRAGFRSNTLRHIYEATLGRLMILLGIHPDTLEMLLRHGGRGGFIRSWRKGVNLDV